MREREGFAADLIAVKAEACMRLVICGHHLFDMILTVKGSQRAVYFQPVIVCKVIYVRELFRQIRAMPGQFRRELLWEAARESTFTAGILRVFVEP